MEIYAKIKLNDAIKNDGGQTYTFDKQPNNISMPASVVPEERTEGVDAVLLSGSAAETDINAPGYYGGAEGGANGNIESVMILGKDKNYGGYRFGATDGNGLYHLALTVTAAEPDGLVYGIIVYGDEAAKQFPIYCDYETAAGNEGASETVILMNANVAWAIKLKEPAHSVTINFRQWSRNNYNACITYLEALPTELKIDKSRIKSIESTSQICADTDELKYDALPGDGAIEIYDPDGEISDYLRDGIITDKNAEVRLYADETLIQTHIVSESEVDLNTKTVKLNFTDRLGQLENLQFDGFSLQKNMSLFTILCKVMSTAGFDISAVKKMCGEYVYAYKMYNYITVENWLKAINIPNPYMSQSSLREAIGKICTAAQLYCYCATDGNIKFVTARPKVYDLDKTAIIPEARIYGRIKKTLFPKLRYENVKMTLNNLELENRSLANFTIEFMKKKDEIENLASPDDLTFFDIDSNVKDIKTYTGQDNAYKVVYFEKTLDTTNMTRYENFSINAEITKYVNKEGLEETITYNSKQAITDVEFLTKNKESFKADYTQMVDGVECLKDDFPKDKKLIVSYCIQEKQVFLMCFATPYYKDPVELNYKFQNRKSKLEIFADVYNPSESTVEF